MILWDLCCCAGTGADGYAAVFGASALCGFDVTEQPDYPYRFERADALALLAGDRPEQADALHTSFPCQILTTAGHLRTAQGGTSRYPDLLTPGLALLRHRLFLSNFPVRRPPPTGPGVYGAAGCRHDTFPTGPNGRPKPVGVYHVPGDKVPSGGHTARDAEHGRQVMGVARTIPWDRLKEGFPPAYTSWVGADLLRHLEADPAADLLRHLEQVS